MTAAPTDLRTSPTDSSAHESILLLDQQRTQAYPTAHMIARMCTTRSSAHENDLQQRARIHPAAGTTTSEHENDQQRARPPANTRTISSAHQHDQLQRAVFPHDPPLACTPCTP
ncbi:hypothetical protein PPTG_00081 [Phytophthora nicotianae INRA-310]|uniref:Uncharacterized protein n=1 Tax=Phytophthora nicotianae (strain INRA-310) TaxID=761204 RepID=W2RE25_PHYN3|nr:hypothetical protein PPTG_00081 [Phytophthora nicotianae INRA-310]ETN23486.1 hypothetical protein PPTG_00081 [Phytophthora nicotianae INRA-310]